MFELVRPDKDATIYEYAPEANTGIDEILELNTRRSLDGTGADYKPSRILISFPNVEGDFTTGPDGPNVFGDFGYETVDRDFDSPGTAATGLGPPNVFAFFGEQVAPTREEPVEEEPEEDPEPNNPTAWLRMWFANGQGLPKKYTIEALPVTKEWREGRGRLENIPLTKEPVNWTERTENQNWSTPGGDFKSSPKSTETFDRDPPDVNMNVNAVLSDNPEHGIILRRQDEDYDFFSELKFFSRETRTIYVPHLLIGRDDYEFQTEGAEPVQERNFTAYVSGLDTEYNEGPVRFDVSVEEKFEQRQFLGIRPTARKESIENGRYLPRRSLTWEIKDVRTGTVFFPFDERYSAVSFDGDRHYFDVNLNNLLPKREYQILLKYTDPETGNETIFDHHQTFKLE